MGKSAPNRQKFVKRYKRQIKRSITRTSNGRSIKDADQSIEVDINGDTTKEPDYHYDPQTGRKTHVNSGNDRYSKGDLQQKPQQGGGSGRQGSDDGDGEDDFTFTLTKEEFFDLYFEDMELPSFIKESLAGSNKFKLKKAGYTKDGVPTRLNGKKTMEMAIARRIAAKAQGKKKPVYLDDVDIRYDNIIRKPYPITKAVMFCIMDVSASMEELDKIIAKKFFTLLYLFLTKCYDNVDVRFIRHTQDAQEVDEDTFFYDRHTGGTMVSSAFILMNQIIEDEINLEETNVYVSQASDGDNFAEDDDNLIKVLTDSILPKVQYMAYIQTRDPIGVNTKWYMGMSDLYTSYQKLQEEHQHFNTKVTITEKDVYPVLRELFERAK